MDVHVNKSTVFSYSIL